MPNSSPLPALVIAFPILLACLLLVGGARMPRRVLDGLAVSGAALVAGLASALLRTSVHEGRVVSWSGGWRPSGGTSVGVVLVADPVGAGAVVLAATLTTVALVFSWRYFDSVQAHFHALMLLFLTGMSGFALSGDLFDMFVFFELMGAVAYALTGLKVEDPTAVQGALSFGLINSLGAYLSLFGIGLLYARTGQLGLAQLGAFLAGRPADVLIAVAFCLVITGFLVKGAIVPFHLWLDDAHAVAPAPVCVLFSGVMVELGLYGALRVYTVVFSASLPGADVHRVLVVLATASALLGAVMCFAQRHLKRLLAYSTVAHLGLFLLAFVTFNAGGSQGALLYIAGHAGIKAALFLIAGVILNRYDSVDELDLHGRGREATVLPWLMLLAGFALAGLPPFGAALGKAIAEDAVAQDGQPWAPVLFALVSALTGGAVVRATLRIYFGIGPGPADHHSAVETEGSTEEPDVGGLLSRVPLTMMIPIVALLALSLALGVAPGVAPAFGEAAERFVDRAGYLGQTLDLPGLSGGAASLVPHGGWSTSGVLLGLLSTVLAAGCAAAALYWDRMPASATRLAHRTRPALDSLRALHSGHVGDYVAWLFVGVAILCLFVVLPTV
jgi:multicomponent Na+:H+ antiporter subunit D